jgi:hypothetical protein
MKLTTNEMDKMLHLYEHHRRGVFGKQACGNEQDVTIEQLVNSIGSIVIIICGCGWRADCTDYLAW